MTFNLPCLPWDSSPSFTSIGENILGFFSKDLKAKSKWLVGDEAMCFKLSFESHRLVGFFPNEYIRPLAHQHPRQVIKSRWWFEIFFMLTHYLGKMNPFGRAYFSSGLKMLVQPPNQKSSIQHHSPSTFHLSSSTNGVPERSVVVQSGQAAKMPCEVVWEVCRVYPSRGASLR